MSRKRTQQSQLSSSQTFSQSSNKTQSQVQLSDYELNILTDKCLRYMLNVSQNWSTIKRQEIVKHVLNGKSKHFTRVFEKVKTDMNEMYGYKIMEIDSDKPNTQQQYYLVRVDDIPCINGLTLSDEQKYHLLIRYLILVHVHLARGSCSNESISSFLEKTNLSRDENSIKLSENIKKLLADLVKQHYLTATNTLNGDSVYSLGSRAQEEYNTEDFEKFADDILTNNQEASQNELTEEN